MPTLTVRKEHVKGLSRIINLSDEDGGLLVAALEQTKASNPQALATLSSHYLTFDPDDSSERSSGHFALTLFSSKRDRHYN